ncbi:hypothetical protein C0Q70_11897 [Pomacea canaliculata]|uniref:Uncharacterized protein n=2 Tax=Pomacea canaliculata TaxID=400727 RepID=A0A2T7P7A0_POMCA|nr:hypothetical protein C0Q70_11897 [Pomacea canaliculata]
MVGLRVDTCLLLKHESNTLVFNTLLCLLGEFALCHELPRVINLLSFSTDSVRLAGFLLYLLRTSMAALTSLLVNTDLHKAVNVLFSRNKGKVQDVFDLGSTGGERENLVENKEVNEPQIVPILYPDGEDGTDPTVATSDNYREIK